MANVFINAKSVKVFLGTVIEAMPYLRASKSYFKDQIVGKKCGRTYSFYLPEIKPEVCNHLIKKTLFYK